MLVRSASALGSWEDGKVTVMSGVNYPMWELDIVVPKSQVWSCVCLHTYMYACMYVLMSGVNYPMWELDIGVPKSQIWSCVCLCLCMYACMYVVMSGVNCPIWELDIVVPKSQVWFCVCFFLSFSGVRVFVPFLCVYMSSVYGHIHSPLEYRYVIVDGSKKVQAVEQGDKCRSLTLSEELTQQLSNLKLDDSKDSGVTVR